MPNGNSKPWRLLALRANVHLGTARMLLDLCIEESQILTDTAAHLRSAKTELEAAQDAVRSIAGVSP